MLPEERKEGSPRFGKLHFPVGLWINSPKKRLAKMSRRWPSAGSVRSTSSDTPSRASDPSDPRPISSSAAPPPKAKPPRHKRLSHLFHRATSASSVTSAGHPHSRWASEKKLSDLRDAPSALLGSGVSPSPPCILKIFGGAISRGANYKSVLATPRCSARALVREALERYGSLDPCHVISLDPCHVMLNPEEFGAILIIVSFLSAPILSRRLNPEEFGHFALCDVVGRPGGPGGAWQGEHLREVGDAERPLLLQELWKPKAGWSRRFEIRRRQDLDRDRERDLDRDGNGDGGDGGDGSALPPPSRRLHRNRSRAASGGPAPPARDPRAGGDAPGPSMRRSISDMNLSTRRRQRKALSVAGGGDSAGSAPPGPPPAPGTPAPNGDGDGDGDGGPSLELLAQCLIQPPRDRPYFLLLRGYGKEDFVLFIMTRPQHIFGRLDRRSGLGGTPDTPDPSPEPPEPPQAPPPQKPDPGPFSVVDTFLDAPDLLPRHCLVQAEPSPGVPAGCDPSPNPRDPPPATVRPFRGAPTTLNGTPLFHRAPLRPGDLLGLGEHVLLLYKDPRVGEGSRPPWAPPPAPPDGDFGGFGVRGVREEPAGAAGGAAGGAAEPPSRAPVPPAGRGGAAQGHPQHGAGGLRGVPRGSREGLGGPEEDLGGPEGDSGGPDEDLGALAPAFLLGLCLEHAAKEFPAGHFPELLGRVAGMLRETVWEKIKEIGDRQPESPPDGDPPPVLDLSGVTSDLRPLLGWLANSVELLNLAQAHLAHLETQLDIEGPCPELEKDLESCDEALGVLDEVIMSTFQQSVYYLTKTLYSALPALLDTNPFVGAGEPRAGPDLGGVPAGLRPPLAVFRAVLGLTRECRLHPDLASQTFGYLFFFSNASLFNTLMEKGSAGPFFQWWVGVRLRTNLDLVLDGLGALGLGDIAGDFFRKLSATANLLCTPRGCLEQATWARLRAEFPALSPAQLHHVLRHYRLGRGRAAPPAWSPSPEESTAASTGDIFESFSDHPPLLLPTRGFRLRPGLPLGPGGLLRPLLKIRRRLWELEGGDDP
ncbi:LOW QUALITY PROTEIN: ras-interacting protein 1 [Ammospiza caudacuta]|uniref:LOW QUALITY PROTEIN: ras-interacting protein 1 n=1 Tax=Ammospiza caudacuta TaxID=2857398 RepID=UPI00273864CF|nr:LOW QUALITY PROTEIN: ras-interacting protein 1 [Ammospiza caudacuta]